MRADTRSGAAGRILLWAVGLPLAILTLALAARSRATLGAGDGEAGAEALPPAIYNPKGPDGDGLNGPQAPDDRAAPSGSAGGGWQRGAPPRSWAL